MELLLDNPLFSPLLSAFLAAVSMGLVWMAFAPAAPQRDMSGRLDDYLLRSDSIVEQELRRPLTKRAIWPLLRGLLRVLGRLLPNKDAERTRLQLQQAGNPGGLTVLDFYGIRILLLILIVGGVTIYIIKSGIIGEQGMLYGLRYIGGGLLVAAFAPVYWLRGRTRKRKSAIIKAMPDCLDMLTIGVEAGLAFESAMIRVSERWDNELTHEFKRAIAEMRIGMTREECLSRLAQRCNVPDLTTFVAVLVQSTQLGVSIAQVLHGQAEVMRERRRQRAEELARQAGIKMLIPLVFFVFPALMVAILGPAIPGFIEVFGNLNR